MCFEYGIGRRKMSNRLKMYRRHWKNVFKTKKANTHHGWFQLRAKQFLGEFGNHTGHHVDGRFGNIDNMVLQKTRILNLGLKIECIYRNHFVSLAKRDE